MLKRLMALVLALVICLPVVCAAAEDEEDDLTIIVEDVNLDELDEEELPDFDADDFDWDSFFEEDTVQETIDNLENLERDESVNPNDLEINPNLPSHVINILLIGVDTHATDIRADSNLLHGDTNILLSINTETGAVTLSSFLRDLYVEIPGYRSRAKLNAAYNRGGGQLAMRTINHNFDLNVDHYVAVNFYGVASIIDSLGGIDIDVTRIEANAINAYLKKNGKKMTYDVKGNASRDPLPVNKSIPKTEKYVVHCDGIQALMYARLRGIDNDFVRTQRQRHLLELLAAKVLQDLNLNKLMDLVSSALPYMITDMNGQTVMSLVMTVMRTDMVSRLQEGGEVFQQFRIPMDKTYSYAHTESGSSVVTLSTKNWQTNIEALHYFIYGNYYPSK